MKNTIKSIFRKINNWRFFYCYIELKYIEQFQFIKSFTECRSDYQLLTFLIENEYESILQNLHDYSDEEPY